MALYSQVIRSGATAMTSGQIAMDPHGAVVGAGDIQTQTIYALEKTETALATVGLNRTNITSLTIYLQNVERDFDGFNAGYQAFFGTCAPARATVGATLFKPEYLIEIQATAQADTNNEG